MREHPLLKIGEFAQIGHVSIATLHHYDEVGLLKPSALDPQTGYRYYAFTQLLRLNRILAFKDLGFSLEQIGQLLQADLAPTQLQAMFQRKQADIAAVIAAEERRLRQLTTHLRQLAEEETLPTYDVLVKHIEPVLVAARRDRIAHISERGQLQATLVASLEQSGVTGPFATIVRLHSRHEVHDGRMSIDLEVAIPLAATLPENAPIHSYTLPEAVVAYTMHTGNELALGRAYIALHDWIDANGYRMVGPVRQIPLRRLPDMNPNEVVTEVQFPIMKLPTTTLPPAPQPS